MSTADRLHTHRQTTANLENLIRKYDPAAGLVVTVKQGDTVVVVNISAPEQYEKALLKALAEAQQQTAILYTLFARQELRDLAEALNDIP